MPKRRPLVLPPEERQAANHRQDLDEAMVAIEKRKPGLKGVLPKDYARPALDKQLLGEVIDLIGRSE